MQEINSEEVLKEFGQWAQRCFGCLSMAKCAELERAGRVDALR